MSLITRLNRLAALQRLAAGVPRFISTSPKKSDTAVAAHGPKTVEDFAKPDLKKNWVYWGFESRDQEADYNATHATFFFSVTLCLVGGAFVYFYQPDFLMRDWAQREAYLELRRREAAGLDPISADYIDPATIELPSDEELGNTEIII